MQQEDTNAEIESESDYEEFIKIYNEGYSDGFNTGKYDGHYLGYNEGRDKGHDEGYNEGYTEGYTEGYEEVDDDGYSNGRDDGKVCFYDFKEVINAELAKIINCTDPIFALTDFYNKFGQNSGIFSFGHYYNLKMHLITIKFNI